MGFGDLILQCGHFGYGGPSLGIIGADALVSPDGADYQLSTLATYSRWFKIGTDVVSFAPEVGLGYAEREWDEPWYNSWYERWETKNHSKEYIAVRLTPAFVFTPGRIFIMRAGYDFCFHDRLFNNLNVSIGVRF